MNAEIGCRENRQESTTSRKRPLSSNTCEATSALAVRARPSHAAAAARARRTAPCAWRLQFVQRAHARPLRVCPFQSPAFSISGCRLYTALGRMNGQSDIYAATAALPLWNPGLLLSERHLPFTFAIHNSSSSPPALTLSLAHSHGHCCLPARQRRPPLRQAVLLDSVDEARRPAPLLRRLVFKLQSRRGGLTCAHPPRPEGDPQGHSCPQLQQLPGRHHPG